jgi:hypothetical protein
MLPTVASQMLPQGQAYCNQANCFCMPQQTIQSPQTIQSIQPTQPFSYYSYMAYQPFQHNQPIQSVYKPQPSPAETEIEKLKADVLQLKHQLPLLKEIADDQLKSITFLTEQLQYSVNTSNKRKSDNKTVDAINLENSPKRSRKDIDYNKIQSGSIDKTENPKSVVEITDEHLNQLENQSETKVNNISLPLSDILDETNEELFAKGDYYIDKNNITVVPTKDNENWIVNLDLITTNKITGHKTITPKKFCIATDLFSHMVTSNTIISNICNKFLKRSIHFITVNIAYFNSNRLLLTKKGLEEFVNVLSFKKYTIQPKDMAIWTNIIEELK